MNADLDMHDLYDLHSKLIRFLRLAVQRLRAVKVRFISPSFTSSLSLPVFVYSVDDDDDDV